MGVLQRFERRLGGLVEGAFAKVFKGGVEPVEIASALARETDDRRAVSSNRILVPNEFAVELASGDHARLAPYTRALCDELAEMVREHAAEQRYTFVGPVNVRLAEAPDLDVGVFRIRSSVAAADPAAVGGRRPRTRSSAPGTPHLIITTRAPSGGPGAGGEREYPLDAETTVIGRSVECDIRLNDTGVSRRHGEIRRLPDGQFLYVDAGSTNGSLVNGRAATQVKLMNGDRIELGTATVEFRREDARGAGAPPPSRRPTPPPPSPSRRPTPPPAPVGEDRFGHRDGGYARPDSPYARPAPGRPGSPGGEPGHRDAGYRRPGAHGDDEYREGPSARFRDKRGYGPDDRRGDRGYRPGPRWEDGGYRDDRPRDQRRDDRHRDGPYRDDRYGDDRYADDPYRSATNPRQHGTGRGRDDGLEALEPLDDVHDADTRLPGRPPDRPGPGDRGSGSW